MGDEVEAFVSELPESIILFRDRLQSGRGTKHDRLVVGTEPHPSAVDDDMEGAEMRLRCSNGALAKCNEVEHQQRKQNELKTARMIAATRRHRQFPAGTHLERHFYGHRALGDRLVVAGGGY